MKYKIKNKSLIGHDKISGKDLVIKFNKKTKKSYYEGNPTLFNNSTAHKLLGESFPKNLIKSTDVSINIDVCIDIYKDLLKKKSIKDIIKFLENTIAPSIVEYLKDNKSDDAYAFFFDLEKFDKDKSINLLTKKFKEIDNFYFDIEKTFTGKLYSYCLMLYAISLGGIIFTDKKKHVEKIWKSLFEGINKSKLLNTSIIPMTFKKKFNGWGREIGMETLDGNKYQTVYEGNFKNGIFNGKGKWNSKQGRSFDGNFKNGLRHGKGTSISSGGEILICNFVNDMPMNGKGELTYVNGDKYIGNFKNHQPHGKGTLIVKKKKTKFFALFQNGQPIKIIKTTSSKI